MFRVLLCITCCSAPPPRQNKQRKSSTGARRLESTGEREKLARGGEGEREQQLVPDGDASKRLIALGAGEKDRLLANQIQANNENYSSYLEKQGNDPALLSTFAPADQNSIAASTSTSLATPALEQRSGASDSYDGNDDNDDDDDNNNNNGNTNNNNDRGKRDDGGADLRTTSSAGLDTVERRLREAAGQAEQLSDYDEPRSDSPPSSIDIGEFTENPQPESVASIAPASEQATAARQPPVSDSSPDERPASGGGGGRQADIPSTTKIGDYARIEYSPMDDLESVTTYSRGGSTKGSRSYVGSTLSRQDSLRTRAISVEGDEAKSALSSRRSSRTGGGIESTSISIASQLSNERLQQNITNVLEQSATPTNFPPFGTIGLPLGPPLDGASTGGAPSETGGRTSPDTPGAALTSASLDSLSDAPLAELGDNNRQSNLINETAAPPQIDSSAGGALVQAEPSDDATLNFAIPSGATAPIASSEDDGPMPGAIKRPSNDDDQSKASTVTAAEQRVGSPQSYMTTTSGGLTNPTPTPSELSQTSQGKKKKLKAKAVLKRFKFGKSKSKSKDDKPTDNAS